MEEEIERIRKKKMEEMKRKKSYNEPPQKEDKEESEKVYDFFVPGGVHIEMISKAAKETGVEITERKFDVPAALPGDMAGSTETVEKKGVCVRGTAEQIENFRKLIKEYLEYFVEKYRRGEKRVKKDSWWWKHYHYKDWKDVRRDKHYEPEKDFKKWKDVMREWKEKAKEEKQNE